MKKKFKLFTGLFALLLTIGLLTFGVYAAKQIETNIEADLEFTYKVEQHVKAVITADVSNTQSDETLSETYDGLEADDYTNTIQLGDLLWKDDAKDGEVITLVITIKNDQSIGGSDLFVKSSAVTSTVNNVVFNASYTLNSENADLELGVTIEPQDELILTYTWTLVSSTASATATLEGLALSLEKINSVE